MHCINAQWVCQGIGGGCLFAGDSNHFSQLGEEAEKRQQGAVSQRMVGSKQRRIVKKGGGSLRASSSRANQLQPGRAKFKELARAHKARQPDRRTQLPFRRHSQQVLKPLRSHKPLGGRALVDQAVRSGEREPLCWRALPQERLERTQPLLQL